MASTRRRIIDAAMSLVEERGMAEVSMTAIAERAELSRQTIYNNFANVEAAVCAFMIDQIDNMVLQGVDVIIIIAEDGAAAASAVESAARDGIRAQMNWFNDTHLPAKQLVLEQLLPLPETEDEEIRDIWDYIYEPDAESLLDTVLTRYIEADVYHAVLENLASEHAARMIAMKNATDNAGDLIDELDAKVREGLGR